MSLHSHGVIRQAALLALLALTACATKPLPPENIFYQLVSTCSQYPTAHTCADVGTYLSGATSKPAALVACSLQTDVLCLRQNETVLIAKSRIAETGFPFDELACDLGDVDSCARAGVHVATISSPLPNEQWANAAEKAEKFFSRGCDLEQSGHDGKGACALKGSTAPQGVFGLTHLHPNRSQ